jgi:hypothetical protein
MKFMLMIFQYNFLCILITRGHSQHKSCFFHPIEFANIYNVGFFLLEENIVASNFLTFNHKATQRTNSQKSISIAR